MKVIKEWKDYLASVPKAGTLIIDLNGVEYRTVKDDIQNHVKNDVIRQGDLYQMHFSMIKLPFTIH